MASNTPRGRNPIPKGAQRDTVAVLWAVGVGMLAAVSAMAILRTVLDNLPPLVAVATVASLLVFVAVVGRALAAKSNSLPGRYKTDPPVLRMNLRSRRQR